MSATDDSSNNLKGGKESVRSDGTDYYSILGIPHNASDKQITTAYKKLALKYHPDRNVDDVEAARQFQAVCDAYHTLIDPVKRKQYDNGGDQSVSTGAPESESVDVGSLGGFGRVFGAMISRLGVPIATQISTDVLETAQSICRSGSLEGGGPPLDARVTDLTWGWGADGKVDRQAAVFYRLSVDAKHVETGFMLLCKSTNKDKFKLILFAPDGSVSQQDDSIRSRDKTFTQASMFFTSFDTFRLDEPVPSSLQDKDIPAVFSKLDNFTPSKRTITPGQYLVAVYGDNFLGKSSFNIVAASSKNDASELLELEETDEQLLQSRNRLEALKAEYIQAKAAFESVVNRMKTESDTVDNLITVRERSYSGFINASLRAYQPNAVSSPGSPDSSIIERGSESGDESNSDSEIPVVKLGVAAATSLTAAASAAAAGASVAAANASAAGGWFVKRVSLGFQSIVKPAARPSEDLTETPTAGSPTAAATTSSGSGDLGSSESHGAAAAPTPASVPVAAAMASAPVVSTSSESLATDSNESVSLDSPKEGAASEVAGLASSSEDAGDRAKDESGASVTRPSTVIKKKDRKSVASA